VILTVNNIDRVKAELEVLSRQDVEGVLSFYSDDVVFIDVSMAEPLRGKVAMREFMQGMYEAFSDLRAENVNVFGDDVFVAAEYDLVGTNDGPLDGQPPTGSHSGSRGIPGFSCVRGPRWSSSSARPSTGLRDPGTPAWAWLANRAEVPALAGQ